MALLVSITITVLLLCSVFCDVINVKYIPYNYSNFSIGPIYVKNKLPGSKMIIKYVLHIYEIAFVINPQGKLN